MKDGPKSMLGLLIVSLTTNENKIMEKDSDDSAEARSDSLIRCFSL